jgi:hypothetical protein
MFPMTDPSPSKDTPPEKNPGPDANNNANAGHDPSKDPVDLRAAFADKANAKFRKIWRAEAEIVGDFDMSVEWYTKWSKDRDAYAQKNDQQRVDFCAGLVDFWDRHLVKATARLAKFKEKIETSVDPVAVEFRQKNFSTLTPVYEALSGLDDTSIKNGKAIFDAVEPLFRREPEPPKPPKPSPLDKGNPFKKGPGA